MTIISSCRSQEEIDDLMNRLQESIDEGRSRYPGMTYEQGIEAAIRWLEEEHMENPMEDDDDG